jgi:DNA recombination protein RmuC
MKKLASHIEQASKDVSDVRISSDKISKRFAQIERVELEHPDNAATRLLDGDE